MAKQIGWDYVFFRVPYFTAAIILPIIEMLADNEPSKRRNMTAMG